MNEQAGISSGNGMVVGCAIGLVLGPVLGSGGPLGMMLGAFIGLVLGVGVAQRPPDPGKYASKITP